ncbi:MAG TPA: NAD(P)H-binding protein [Streptosporangiaceae bacterium]|jgi:NADH dehydrogenase|nr:NAD(P)H-binding protein [Streptosporangiaceae bacterium]
MTQVDAVTGAFSYSGAAIARDLIQRGNQVRTLTGHTGRAPAGTPIEVRPLDFGDERELAASLAGVRTLYNTYWVRFAHGAVSHELAVANSRVLFAAAVTAGVQRIVHVSITNPSEDSPDPYFRGKAAVEQALAASGVPSYAIVRPAVLFGGDGVLLNNIAWLLRHLPVFAIGGRGDYRLRPIHVDDLAALCTDLGGQAGNVTVDAVGPESVTFRQLVETIKAAVGSRTVLMPAPGALIPLLAAGLNLALKDTLLTADEYASLAAGRADSAGPATGTTVLTDWIRAHGDELGRHYANELDRHFRTGTPEPA